VPYLTVILAVLILSVQPNQDRDKHPSESKKSSQYSGCEIQILPTTSNTINESPNEPCKQPSKTDTQNKYQIIEHSTPFLNTLATIAIAVFTILTFLIYRAQLAAMKINARAWIVPIIHPIEPTADPLEFQVTVDLANTGKTPAWITSAGSRGKGATAQAPLPTVPTYDDMKPFSKKGDLLSPNGSFAQPFKLTKERLDHVQTGQSQLFIFGYAAYRDVYGGPHIVRYCFEAKKSHDANHSHPLEFYVGGPDGYMDAD
jgi:hypothetical protein